MLGKCTITLIIIIGNIEIVLVKGQDWRLKIRFSLCVCVCVCVCV